MFALGLQSPQCWCLRLRSSSHDLITEWMGAEQYVETVTVSDRDGVKVEQHLDSVCLVTQLLLYLRSLDAERTAILPASKMLLKYG